MDKEKKTADYYKYQWEYKKTHYYTVSIPFSFKDEDDVINSLKNFEGDRSKWIKGVIRNALVSEGRYNR